MDGGQASRETELLDPRQGKWISVPSMINNRSFCGLAAVNGLLYAVGGNSGNETLNSVEVYDPRACRWTAAQPMLKKRCDAGVTVFCDQIVVVGGSDENGLVLPSAEVIFHILNFFRLNVVSSPVFENTVTYAPGRSTD
ncbi:unnamed protein product [Nippostrongylus brasiliensis]|uniref:Kelch-like protein 7 (inferred by orthology to a human protein) n=1 Tax=Nippostrongylus brasiliensis TaxID=27835 RepID=A0A0N4Y8U6_NIPBR|nr:unnamed protein product [Nippostrongylus brasiliensis]